MSSFFVRFAIFAALVGSIPLPPSRAEAQGPDQKQALKYFQQAQALEKANPPAAVEAMTKAIELAPKNDAYFAYLARLELQSGNDAKALDYGREAMKIKPGTPSYLAFVMRVALTSRQFEVAKEAAALAMELGPAKTGKTIYDEARTTYAKSSALLVDKHFNNVFNERDLGKFKAAVAAIEDAIKADPKNKVYPQRLAMITPLGRTAELDKYALDVPPGVEITIDALAEHLAKPAKKDADKVRLISRWMADRIAFDAQGLVNNKIDDQSAPEVLKNRRAIGAGYSDTFFQLAKRMGMEVSRVPGICRGIAWHPGPKEPSTLDHAWNAVKVDGQWRFVDAAWAAGAFQSKNFVKQFDEAFVLVPAERLIFTHFPADARAQLLDPPVTRDEFDGWPDVGRALFRVYPDVPVEKVKALTQKKAPLVRTFPSLVAVKFVDVPLTRKLAAGKQYKFEIDAPGCDALTFTVGSRETAFSKKEGRFEGRLTPVRGTTLIVRAHRIGDGASALVPLALYEVE